MDNKQKWFIVILGIVFVMLAVKYGLSTIAPTEISPDDITVSERNTSEEEPHDASPEKRYVKVFFIGQNTNHEEVYKAVKREYDPEIDGTKLKFAMNALIAGPKSDEKNRGIYTEIPDGTDLISVKELQDKVIVNLTADFETGGGTDSLYKRLYQVIKTANQNSTLPVYLYIEGQRADVIGGEGIMLNQPLNDRSLDG